MDEASVEAAFQAAGFQMHSKEQLGNDLMHLARMRRKQERYEKVPGIMRYEVTLANYRWTIYMLLRETQPHLLRAAKNSVIMRLRYQEVLMTSGVTINRYSTHKLPTSMMSSTKKWRETICRRAGQLPETIWQREHASSFQIFSLL